MNKFNNKQEYIDWRTEWKKGYLECSQTIRKLKWDVKDAQRHKEPAPQRLLHEYKEVATDMLMNLKEAKAESWRQKQLTKTEN